MSLTVSLEPFSPPTVEMRDRSGVFLPTWDRNFASVKSEISSSTSKVPLAPAALACTLLSLYVSKASRKSVVSVGVPLWDSFACKMSERLDQLSVAKHSETAVSLAELYLVGRAWIFTWLTFC